MKRLGLTKSDAENQLKIEALFDHLLEASDLRKYIKFDFAQSYHIYYGKLRISLLERLFVFENSVRNGSQLNINFSLTNHSVREFLNSSNDLLEIIDNLTKLSEEAEKYDDIQVYSESLTKWRFITYVYRSLKLKYPDAILSFTGSSIILPSVNYLKILFELEYYRSDAIIFDFIDSFVISATNKGFKESLNDKKIIEKIHNGILMSLYSSNKYFVYDERILEFIKEVAGRGVDSKEIRMRISSVIPDDFFQVAATSFVYYGDLDNEKTYFKYKKKYYYYDNNTYQIRTWDNRDELIDNINKEYYR